MIRLFAADMIQKMDYLAQGFYDEAEPLTEAGSARSTMLSNQQDYKKAPSATFTHVFISSKIAPRS